MKIQKKIVRGGGEGFGFGGCQGGCERRIEFFMKLQKKFFFFFFFFFFGGGGGGPGDGGRGVRVGMNEELKFLGKFKKKNRGVVRGVSLGSGWWGWVRVDVNAMLGVGGDVGNGGCEPRIEGIVQCTKGIVQY